MFYVRPINANVMCMCILIGECGWSVISSSVATMYYIDADFGNCWWFEERTCKTWVIFIRCGSGLWTIWVHNRRISINCIKISYDAIDLFLFFFLHLFDFACVSVCCEIFKRPSMEAPCFNIVFIEVAHCHSIHSIHSAENQSELE